MYPSFPSKRKCYKSLPLPSYTCSKIQNVETQRRLQELQPPATFDFKCCKLPPFPFHFSNSVLLVEVLCCFQDQTENEKTHRSEYQHRNCGVSIWLPCTSSSKGCGCTGSNCFKSWQDTRKYLESIRFCPNEGSWYKTPDQWKQRRTGLQSRVVISPRK